MYRTKRAVIDGIKTRIRQRNGVDTTLYDAYLGYDPFSGKQKRLSSASLDDLKAQIDDFYAKYKVGGDAAVRLKAAEAQDAREALDLLAQNKTGLSLAEVVRRFLQGAGAAPAASPKKISEAIAQFIESRAGKSADYVRTLASRLGAWAADFGADRNLGEVEVKGFVAALKERLYDKDDQKTWKTYNNHLGDLKTFFGWCADQEQGFLQASPIASVKKIVIPWHEPDYVRAEDIAKLFAVLVRHRDEHPEDLADAILSFFCGMRQCEIERIRLGGDAVKVNTEEMFIRVIQGKGFTSGKRPRAFTIPETAQAWIRSFDFDAAIRVKDKRFRRHLVRYAAEAKITLPENAGRHTFITMFAAAYHDQKLLESIVGNTEGVRANSYDGVESERNGKAYFAITPEAVQNLNTARQSAPAASDEDAA